MRIEIDQSGKVEDTNRLTVVAFCNGKTKSLKISAIEKRKVLATMKSWGYPKHSFVYKTFAGLVFLLIKNEKASEVVIDKEYVGNEPTIKVILLQLFQKYNIKPPTIAFGNIGKKSMAHEIAIIVFRNKRRADIIVDSKRVLNLFFK